MNLLLIGGSGYVGRNLALYLAQKKFNVTISFNENNSFSEFDSTIRCTKLNILDQHECVDKVKNFDAAINLACLAKPASATSPSKSFQINVLGAENVVTACSLNNVPLIFISSSEVYGPSNFKLNESSKCIPNSVYGRNKLIGEFVCQTHNFHDFLDYVILRPFNLYGSVTKDNNRKTVESIFLESATKNQSIKILDNKDSTRDFTYIYDFCRIIEIILLKNNFNNNIYNVGSSVSTSLYELASICCKIAGKKEDLIEIIQNNNLVERYSCDNAKIVKEFGFQDFTPLENGLIELRDSMYA